MSNPPSRQVPLRKRRLVRNWTSARAARGSVGLIQLKEEKIGERRLRSFDLRGKHGFFPNICVQKEREIREQRRSTVEPPESQQCGVEPLLENGVELQRGVGRQRIGDKG